MPQKKPYALARYINEATSKPFELIVDDKRSIVIEQPSSQDVLMIDQAENTEEAFRVMVGDKFDEVMKAIGDTPGRVLKLVIDDIRDHFKLGE
jgi:hypothetical protein